MHFNGHAFVDWDDTIAEDGRYFREAAESISRRIASLTGCDGTEISRRGDELDVLMAQRMGMVTASFGTARVACYREFVDKVGVQADPRIEEEIRIACLQPYQINQALIPGAAETLGWLRRIGFEITIWTGGDRDVQERKVRRSGLDSLIHRVIAVSRKTTDELRKAVGKRKISQTFLMGNSLYSDIQPGLELGILALHVPTQQTWAYDQASIDTHHPLYRRVEGITQVPSLVWKHFRSVG